MLKHNSFDLVVLIKAPPHLFLFYLHYCALPILVCRRLLTILRYSYSTCVTGACLSRQMSLPTCAYTVFNHIATVLRTNAYRQ